MGGPISTSRNFIFAFFVNINEFLIVELGKSIFDLKKVVNKFFIFRPW